MTPAAERRLGMMTKYWEPGRVKTRLAGSWMQSPARLERWVKSQRESPPIREEKAFTLASELHRAFVFYLLENLRACGDQRELVGSPGHRLRELTAAISPFWQVVDQGGGDLGSRMSRWFLRGSTDANAPASISPSSHSVLIGSDCPLLGVDTVTNAFDRLENHDLVLGPASDGGYYLIGISARSELEQAQAIFQGIAWSTSKVLSQTLQAADQLGWRVSLLDTHDDVDTVEDLDRLLDRASASREHLPFFNELVEVVSSGLEMPR